MSDNKKMNNDEKEMKEVKVDLNEGYTGIMLDRMKRRAKNAEDPQDFERRKKAWFKINNGNLMSVYTLPMMYNIPTEDLEKRAEEAK